MSKDLEDQKKLHQNKLHKNVVELLDTKIHIKYPWKMFGMTETEYSSVTIDDNHITDLKVKEVTLTKVVKFHATSLLDTHDEIKKKK